MQHPSARDLYIYWSNVRGVRAAPTRADIDPTAIPHVLADSFLLERDTAGDLTFRLAGTQVCALVGRELKGESFIGLFETSSHQAVHALFHVVTSKTVVVVATVSCSPVRRPAAELELLILPLRYRGSADSRIIGVLAPTVRPYWLGAKPAGALSLAMYRYILPIGGRRIEGPGAVSA